MSRKFRCMSLLCGHKEMYKRRAVVIVWTAISLVVLLAFLALAVDFGYIYHVKAQLQRTADAAAMAAASQIASYGIDGDADDIFDIAAVYAAMNKVAADLSPQLSEDDVVLGKAVDDGSGRYIFYPGLEPYDAVKVTVRLTSNSPNGPLPLFFGGILGKSYTELSASATAMLVPRDIAVVIDLSNSMSYDSQLRNEDRPDMNIYEVWQDLGSPTFGNMTVFHNSASEMPHYSSKYSTNKIKKLLGLNGVPYPYPGGSWDDYIDYVKHDIYPYQYRNRYGLRTWVNYLLDRCSGEHQTPTLSECRVQPVHAVKEAVEELCLYLMMLESDDHVALCSYSGRAYFDQPDARTHEHLTNNYEAIIQAAYARQAGEYGRYTNIYAGIEEAISELTSSYARPNAKKVIFLMTDGNPNQPGGSYSSGRYYTLMAAEHAADLNIQIYTISLGSEANQELMEEVAEIGKGIHYYVPVLDISQCEEDLKRVFRTLGGKRPVRLIE